MKAAILRAMGEGYVNPSRRPEIKWARAYQSSKGLNPSTNINSHLLWQYMLEL